MVNELISFLTRYRKTNPNSNKEELSKAAAKALGLKLQRTVYVGNDYAVRYSACSGPSFSNGVLSLSALQSYDDMPFVVCVVRPNELFFLLANSTFLKKISHSSHQLRIDNIRGTFLGNDIIRSFEGIENTPENFDRLWALHREFSWEENLVRLVEATTNISPTGSNYKPSKKEIKTILEAPRLASKISSNPVYKKMKMRIEKSVLEKHQEILRVAKIDNVNIRGNRIEQAITGGGNVHSLGDWEHSMPEGVEIQLEIKTKLMHRLSSPKAYNIDKVLEYLSRGNKLLAFCFVGIDLEKGNIQIKTLSMFDKTILDSTRIQFHWAGRNSRGVTQLTNDFSKVLIEDYQEKIVIAEAKSFLRQLIEIEV